MRVLVFALLFRRLKREHPELFDGKAAVAAVNAAIAAELEVT